ncbi:uncharacterized protein HKW66_Vig0008780 [Vigna angularis]|uniref:Uncharacterized protein n=1 Tax=Phaseolus angularis TaxID=3914 RepID=A0A8T0LI59_PHAAN|nr:uncharacterized protein HKW66_Vig0008780 [Vigna angularis]
MTLLLINDSCVFSIWFLADGDGHGFVTRFGGSNGVREKGFMIRGNARELRFFTKMMICGCSSDNMVFGGVMKVVRWQWSIYG